MDNVTHTLFALTLGRTSLGRAGRGTTAALVLASSAPDVDFVASLGGANYLTWHRGPTHGPLGIVGLGVVTAAVVWGGRRLVATTRRDPTPNGRDAPFRILVLISMVGVLFHVLLDLPTSYGTRLLSPFDWRWFAADWMPIVDVYMLGILATGLLFGTVSAARRRTAAIVLALMAANYGLRAVAHHDALSHAPRIFGPRLPQSCDPRPTAPGIIDYWPRQLASVPREGGRRCLVEMVALPSFTSPFRWRVIAHLSNAYELHEIDLLDRRLRRPPEPSEAMWRTTVRVPNIWTPPVFAAASTDVARAFLGFSRLPAARVIADPSGAVTVRWTDLRFVGPVGPIDRPTPRNDLFTLAVRVAPDRGGE